MTPDWFRIHFLPLLCSCPENFFLAVKRRSSKILDEISLFWGKTLTGTHAIPKPDLWRSARSCAGGSGESLLTPLKR